MTYIDPLITSNVLHRLLREGCGSGQLQSEAQGLTQAEIELAIYAVE